MPKNVMKQLKPKANIGRNAFDLSHRAVFSANFGELLPCCCIETVPSNDEIRIRPADLVRALPLATSPFLRAKQHIDFWFVPYSAIWSRFNEFMVDRSEPASAALNDRTYLPYVSLDDLLSAVQSDNLFDIVGRKYSNGAIKLLNLLGYGITDGFNSDDLDIDPKVNLFRLCAYNYIWYKEYRQQYYDTGLHLFPSSSNSSLVARLWNLDDVRCNSVESADVLRERVLSELVAMTQLRYRCYKKDLFTGLMPSQQYGDVSVIKGSLSGNLSVLGFENAFSGGPQDVSDDLRAESTGNGSYRTTLFNSGIPLSVRNTGISVLDLRKAEAVQRWRENALRAGNQVEDNFEAHYGAKPRSHMIQHPTFIGSYDAPLNIGDVVSTAQVGDGENQSLGDIAGKGLSSVNGNEVTFKTNDFGVIIGMFSLLPETEYNSTGIDRMNQLLEREDFFVPEYERLGLEPVDAFTFVSSYHGEPVDRKGIIGFAPRYWGYKQKLDLCFGEFQHNNYKTGMFAHWCSPKSDVNSAIMSMQNTGVFPLSLLYVNPAIFDINFNVSVDNADQFLVDMYNQVTAIRGMSVSGMPGF